MSGLINANQTPEERRAKYWLALSLGCTATQARSWRDVRLSYIERYFHLVKTYQHAPMKERVLLHCNTAPHAL